MSYLDTIQGNVQVSPFTEHLSVPPASPCLMKSPLIPGNALLALFLHLICWLEEVDLSCKAKLFLLHAGGDTRSS
jgi:hypothetical protein